MRLADKSVHLTPKAMAVLVRLADAKGHVVARNDILDTVWPGAAVTDDVLTQCVVELRKAFHDSAHNPRYIETIPRKGFRLVAPVSDIVDEVDQPTNGLTRGKFGLVAVAVAAIVIIATWILFEGRQDDPPGSAPQVKTVAVLPFADTSPDGDQGHIADGISDAVVIRLGSVEDLLVVARTSSFFYRARLDNIEAIARDLGVRYFLKGSIRRAGNNIRVTAQLLDTQSGYQLWGETYDRPIEDIFAVQDEIAEAVATALSLTLNVGLLRNAGTRSVEAFEEYWLGIEAYYGKGSDPYVNRDGHRRGLAHFLKATRLDPNWGNAWAYLALTYWWGRAHDVDDQSWTELALEALQRANELAPNLPLVANVHSEIHTALGNWRLAEDGIRRLDMLRKVKPANDARQAAALAIWPTDFAYWIRRLDLNIKTGRAVEIIEAAKVLRARYPDMWLPSLFLGHLHIMHGESEEARELIEETKNQIEGLFEGLGTNDPEYTQRWLGMFVGGEASGRLPGLGGINTAMSRVLDDRDAALAWLRDANERESAPEVWVAAWAGYHGGSDIALDALRRNPDGWVIWLPVMESVRRDPGFVDLVHDIGLVDYWEEFGWGDFCARTESGDIVCK